MAELVVWMNNTVLYRRIKILILGLCFAVEILHYTECNWVSVQLSGDYKVSTYVRYFVTCVNTSKISSISLKSRVKGWACFATGYTVGHVSMITF